LAHFNFLFIFLFFFFTKIYTVYQTSTVTFVESVTENVEFYGEESESENRHESFNDFNYCLVRGLGRGLGINQTKII